MCGIASLLQLCTLESNTRVAQYTALGNEAVENGVSLSCRSKNLTIDRLTLDAATKHFQRFKRRQINQVRKVKAIKIGFHMSFENTKLRPES